MIEKLQQEYPNIDISKFVISRSYWEGDKVVYKREPTQKELIDKINELIDYVNSQIGTPSGHIVEKHF